MVLAFYAALLCSNPPSRRGRQLCAATNPDCRIPIELRDPSLHRPSDPSKPYPRGHLKPVGHHDFAHLWDGEVKTLAPEAILTPHDFWTRFHPHKPFVFRGACKKHPAFSRWTNDSYLTQHFGHYRVKIESKHEDRLADYCGAVKELGQEERRF